MARHNPEIYKAFAGLLNTSASLTEHELQEKLRPVIIGVEKDNTYSTNQKLKIFSLLTSLSNCAPKEREKFAKKAARLLK